MAAEIRHDGQFRAEPSILVPMSTSRGPGRAPAAGQGPGLAAVPEPAALVDEPPLDAPPGTLRALVRLAALVTSTQEPAHLIEAVAETAKALLTADSLSISKFDRDRGELTTLINVGELGAGEQRWPTNEAYRVADFPDTLGFLSGRPVRHLATSVDDAQAEPAEVRLLTSLGKRSSLKAAIVLDGHVWGELWGARAATRAPFDEADGALAEVIAALVSAGLAQANAWHHLHSLAVTDPMTGLANRRALDEHLVRHLARCQALGLPLAVVVADLNGLKTVNDTYGHAAGDEAILHAAAAAAASVSGVPDALAARLGGDEFALVLPGVAAGAARRVASLWCHGAIHPDYLTSLACGVAVADHAGRPRTDTARLAAGRLLARADGAQYDAKRSGASAPVVVEHRA
jgi:diguanylate cyclase (GGDEF)-like protein